MTGRTNSIASCAVALLLAFGCDIHVDISDTGADEGNDEGNDDGEEGTEETDTGGEESDTGSPGETGAPGTSDTGLAESEGGEESSGEESEGGEESDTGPVGPECHPLQQDCPEGDACYGVQEGFACAPDASGLEGAEGDPCEFINVCDPGLQCVAAELLPSCFGSSCCTPFCDLSGGGECNDPETECVAYYPEGEAPPGLEDVGLCASAG